MPQSRLTLSNDRPGTVGVHLALNTKPSQKEFTNYTEEHWGVVNSSLKYNRQNHISSSKVLNIVQFGQYPKPLRNSINVYIYTYHSKSKLYQR